jgi:hypothetical protein
MPDTLDRTLDAIIERYNTPAIGDVYLLVDYGLSAAPR